jgi:hypothetical protein
MPATEPETSCHPRNRGRPPADPARGLTARRAASSPYPRPMSTTWPTADGESDEAAFPDPPGGGILVAIAGGLSAAGAMFLVFAAPLVFVWLVVAAILTGIATRRAIHLVTATVAAIAPAAATFVFVQCLTGAWGWLLAGIVLFAAICVVGVPLGFAVGRLLRGRLARWYPGIRGVLVVTAVLSAIGWAIVIGNAIAPGECPAGA